MASATFLFVISELVSGVPYQRRIEIQVLSTGEDFLEEAQDWFNDVLLPELLEDMPGRSSSNFQADYVELETLTL